MDKHDNGFSHSKISLGTNQEIFKCYIANISYILVKNSNLLQYGVITQLKLIMGDI